MSRRRRVLIGAGHLAALIGLAAAVLAQSAGVHPISGRRFAAVMSADGADWLDRSERETEEAPDEALDIIGIKKGSVVADIGAGSGYMTIRMARRVGANGIVYANDIQQPMLDLLDQRLKKGRIAERPPDPRHAGRSKAAPRVDRDGAAGGRVPRVLPATGDAAPPARRAEDRRPAGAARVPQGGSLDSDSARNTR